MFNGSENYPAPQEGMDTPTNPPDMGRKYGPTGIIAGFFEGLRQKALLGKLEKTRQFEDKRRAITAESRQAADQARIDSEKQNNHTEVQLQQTYLDRQRNRRIGVLAEQILQGREPEAVDPQDRSAAQTLIEQQNIRLRRATLNTRQQAALDLQEVRQREAADPAARRQAQITARQQDEMSLRNQWARRTKATVPASSTGNDTIRRPIQRAEDNLTPRALGEDEYELEGATFQLIDGLLDEQPAAKVRVIVDKAMGEGAYDKYIRDRNKRALLNG